MVEQQEMKSVKLLSSEPVHLNEPNDQRWKEMWYIVSKKGIVWLNVIPSKSFPMLFLLAKSFELLVPFLRTCDQASRSCL